MSVLLRQAHGFECLCSVHNVLEPDGLSVAIGHYQSRRNLEFHAPTPAAKSKPSECNHAIADSADKVVRRIEHLEVLGIVCEELSQPRTAAICALNRRALGNELSVFGEALDPDVDITAPEGFKHPDEGVYVRLGHRLRAVSPRLPSGDRRYAAPVAGYSGTALPKKLGIKEGSRVAVVGAPDGFLETTLRPLPDAVELRSRARGPLDLIVFFTKRRAELERRFDTLVKALDRAGALWVAWPKGSSGVATDMTENTVRDVALPKGLVDTKVAAIDDTWSGLKHVIRLENR